MSSPINFDVDRAAACAFECAQKIRGKLALRHPEDYPYALSMLYQFLVQDNTDEAPTDVHCRTAALRAATDDQAMVSPQAFELQYYGKRHPQEKQAAFLVRSIIQRAEEHLQEMGALVQFGKLGPGVLTSDGETTVVLEPWQDPTAPEVSTPPTLASRRHVIFKN